MTIIIQQQGNVPVLSEPNYSMGGMSFLDMVKRLRSESGTSGAAPVTTVNQAGDVRALVDWISTAWMDIQNERDDWFFMRQNVQFNTVAGQGSYTAAQAGIGSFGNFKKDSFRQYRQSYGFGSEIGLAHMPWDQFRNLHLFGNMRTIRQMPYDFTVDPAKNFVLGPVPDDVYVVNGEAYALPTEFSQDSDRPTLPSQYHMMIVWRALMYYGQKENAPEAYSHGQNEYGRLMTKLMADQLPTVTLSGALC